MNQATSIRNMLFSELTFWVALCGISLYFLFPLRQNLKLGIDLSGGTYLTLEVETDKAVDAELVEFMQSAQTKIKEARLSKPKLAKVEKKQVVFEFDNLQDVQAVASLLKGLPGIERFRIDSEGATLRVGFASGVERQIKNEAVERNIGVLRSRVADVDIMKKGENQIIVELPDVADPQKAKSIIGKAAQLEFRLVYQAGPTKEDLELEYDDGLPPDREILPGGPSSHDRFYLVQRYPEVTGKMLKDASPGVGGETMREPQVDFKFNAAGAQKFHTLTSSNYGKRLAIVLDGVVISAPQIHGAISDNGTIHGGFTMDSARELAMLLKSGSYVAPVTFQEERHIGPSLGQESINQGYMSCAVGLGFLLVFSFFYYGFSGLFAFLALVYNLILILIGLSLLKQPLTLPGIGGMVLTVGMAIDASILIFESIKDELAKGEKLRKAVSAGFSDAMVVILDANITTFIVGAVLYKFGTGPIQGFATTMMLGIVATLLTGLFFLRSLFRFVLTNFNIERLRI